MNPSSPLVSAPVSRPAAFPRESQTVGRLAPSPTGHLHLGHAFAFLVAWWSSRSAQGRVVLRIEDLDADRVDPAFVEQTINDLRWLGLDWEGQPRLQSEGMARTLASADRLHAQGRAYPCVCSRKDVERAQLTTKESASPSSGASSELSAPQAGGRVRRYPGTCRGRYSSLADAQRSTGRPAGLRFVCSPGEVEFVDERFGRQAFDVDAEAGDFLIVRRDNIPCYQLAVVADDALDAVTEVVRGCDLLSSTARQLLLYRALGSSPPSWLHLPLICDHRGQRLAKRSAALSLRQLRERGVSAEAIVGWAACAAGQRRSSASVAAREVAESFDRARLPDQNVILPEDAQSLFA